MKIFGNGKDDGVCFPCVSIRWRPTVRWQKDGGNGTIYFSFLCSLPLVMDTWIMGNRFFFLLLRDFAFVFNDAADIAISFRVIKNVFDFVQTSQWLRFRLLISFLIREDLRSLAFVYVFGCVCIVHVWSR